jgi:hypothetical protein
MPRTDKMRITGKIRKVELREWAKELKEKGIGKA